MESTSLFVSAGDPSGDNAAFHLVHALREMHPSLTFFGLGGERLKKLGQEQLAESSQLAVLGFWEVARHAWFFKKLLRRCVEEIARRRPKALVLIDYPGFNLRLAKKVKRLGIPVIYYISPQVWAWGRRRVKVIRKYVDTMIVILPFEKDFYEQFGIEAHFVGHYLLEDIPKAYIASPIPSDGSLALLPGSRPQEIERMLPVMLETARQLYRTAAMPAVVAARENTVDYEKYLSPDDSPYITLSYEDSRKIIYESSLVLTASGTATLETAVIGRPMVVVYKTGLVTYHIARRMVKLDNIALVNLVLGKKVVPELIQNEATPRRIFAELEKFRTDSSYVQAVKKELDRVPKILGNADASRMAARLIARKAGLRPER